MELNLEEIIKKIKPTKEENKEEMELVKKIFDLLKDEPVKPMLVGSLAKDTDLAGNKDLDIFIQFPPTITRDKLEKEGLRIGKDVFKKFKVEHEIDYAEHPYVKGIFEDHNIEIVPCYMDSKQIMSAVDRTPHHTKYVKEKLKDTKLNDEIRLLKQFMRGINVYGAEAKVEGFSGYLVELLIINYGSFIKTLEATHKWNIPQAIDIESLWKDFDALPKFFTDASLIIVDPVDKNRNVAAAVSPECLSRFIVKSSEFIKNQSEEFFFPKEKPQRSIEELKKALLRRNTRITAVVFKHSKINVNTLYAQLRKTSRSIVSEFNKFEFTVFIDSFWTNETDTSVIILEFKLWQLPQLKHNIGPPVNQDPVNQERFTQKYFNDEPYVKDGRWVVDTKRKYQIVKELTPKIINERLGFGKHLREIRDITVLEDEKLYSLTDPGWIKFMNEYLD